MFRGRRRASRLLALSLCMSVAGCGTARSAALIGPPERGDGQLGPGINPHVIVEPRDGVRPVTRALDRAQHSIFVETYILSDRRVVHALERAAAQSVRVDVLLEPHALGMGSQPLSMAQQLRAAGVAVRWTNPRFALTHAKLMLVDGRSALISTANYSRSGFSSDRDFMVWDRMPEDVRAIDALFRDDWDREPAAVEAPNLVVAPVADRLKLSRLISSARSSLEVYGEEMADPRTERLLVRQACRGVAVRVLLPSAPVEKSAIYDGGCVRIRVLRRPYAHAKVIVADGRNAFLGSENISAQSLDRNREVGVLLGQLAAKQLQATFESDWRRGLPVHAEGS